MDFTSARIYSTFAFQVQDKYDIVPKIEVVNAMIISEAVSYTHLDVYKRQVYKIGK